MKIIFFLFMGGKHLVPNIILLYCTLICSIRQKGWIRIRIKLVRECGSETFVIVVTKILQRTVKGRGLIRRGGGGGLVWEESWSTYIN
jgi:hypothetical protein